MSQTHRAAHGGALIDRDVPLRFSFNGKRFVGYRGDTLAAALLANGVHVVGRSLKYRRPRGIFTAGPDEPNAIVTVGEGARRTPNLKATEVLIRNGLVATSQRGWPSVDFDVGALTAVLRPFLPAGFYYKTFMRPRQLWPLVEGVLRRAAASGRLSPVADPDRYDKRHLHCDVLVIGAGPAGLAAAAAAADSGVRVVLAESEPQLGGCLLDGEIIIDGDSSRAWIDANRGRLQTAENATILTDTTVFGGYGHNRFGAVQHLHDRPTVQRYWQIQAGRVVFATGALERPLLFANNDRPGVMLASAAQRYARRFGVQPGRRAVVVTNNDSTASAVVALRETGVEIVAVFDTRATGALGDPTAFSAAGVRGVKVNGRGRVKGVTVRTTSGRRDVDCDLVCVSGGWTPTVHLHSGTGGRTWFDARWGAFVPDPTTDGSSASAGACAGTVGVASAIAHGATAGDPNSDPPSPVVTGDLDDVTPGPTMIAPKRGHVFVDLSTDVDVHAVEVAVGEGYDGVQHVKRYTTMGMGPDQGKSANVNGAAVIAELSGRSLAEMGTTTYRPPYVPITLGALAARESGTRIAALRMTPMHDWHTAHDAVMMPSALWSRPRYFAAHGADVVTAATAEARNVRDNVGLADVSTLGKIELRGPDVGVLLDLVYTNRFSTLAVGKARYGVMLRDDGYVMDDGTTSRLDADRWLLTTTTGNAEAVLQHLESCHQVLRPDLDLAMASVTDQWAVVSLAGPNSRAVLAGFLDGADVSSDEVPFMGVRDFDLGGVIVRVTRVSFPGELGFEVAVPADYGLAMWERLMKIGEPWAIIPYGLEAMDYLRIEKGHLVVGMDIDGRVSPYDVGLGGMCSTTKDFIGRRSLEMPVFADQDRQKLVGFMAAHRDPMIVAGAQLVADAFDGTPQPSHGRVTSSAFSPVLDRPIALGLLVGGTDRIGARLHAASPITGDQVEVEVVSPHFYDPSGQRQRA